MKLLNIFLLAACVFCITSAFGQATAGASVMNSQPVVFQSPSHPEHASAAYMATGQNLLGSGAYASAQGERPLWEVAPTHVETPLGDTARELKKERVAVKKAKKVWEN